MARNVFRSYSVKDKVVPETASQFKYWAFLSYSHTDRKWGDWLHKALETYRVPTRLVGKDSRDGKISQRLFPVFRDREELPVSADLGAKINEALRESRYLIVICSRHSAQSRWVGQEIKAYKKLGREDRILALIVDGEPNASDGKPGFKVEDECFHEAMRYRWSEDDHVSPERTEPIAADAREGKDGKENAKLKLLAGLLGVNYDDLRRREQERRIRRLRIVLAVALATVSGFAAVSVYAWRQKHAAEQAQASAEKAQARTEAEKLRTQSALDETRRALSESDFLQALRSINEDKDFDALAQLVRSLSFNPKNEAAVFRLTTLLAYRSHAIPLFRLSHDEGLTSAQFSPDGQRVLTLSNGKSYGDPLQAQIWDTQIGKPLARPSFHIGQVKSAQFSPDGNRVVTASSDNTARIWDAKTGKALGQPMKHDASVASAQFSPDGKRILTWTANPDNTLSTARVWNSGTGTPLFGPMKHDGAAYPPQFSPDGKLILTLCADNTARMWSADTGKSLAQPMKHAESIRSAQFSPDSKRIMTASFDKTARVWDAATGKPLTRPMRHESAIYLAELSRDGKRILTVSGVNNGHVCQVWNADTGQALNAPLKHDRAIMSAHFSPDAKLILIAFDGDARVWNAETGKPAEPMRHDNFMRSAGFSGDGERIVTASVDGTARVWDGKCGQDPVLQRIHPDVVFFARFSADGKRVLTAGPGAARVWDLDSDSVSELQTPEDGAVVSLQFKPDGTGAIAWVEKDTVQIWDVETGKPLTELMTHELVHAAELSTDGKRMVTAADDSVRVWDAETGRALTEPIKYDSRVRSAKFSPDGKRIVTISGRSARILDAETGKLLADLIGDDSAQFSPDGKRIATSSSDGVRVWDAETSKPLAGPIKHAQSVNSIEFSPDGKLFVTACDDRFARVWQTETGMSVAQPMEHGNSIRSAQFSPDGKRIVTASWDGTARVWDAKTGTPLSDPLKHLNAVNFAGFSPNGERIVTASNDKTARIWDLVPSGEAWPEWLTRLAEAIAGQHLSDRGIVELPKKESGELLREIRDLLNREPIDDKWAIWGRWFLGDRWTRTITPFSKLTVPEYIRNCIEQHTRESLDEAEQLSAGNAQLLGEIVAARKSLPPKRGQ